MYCYCGDTINKMAIKLNYIENTIKDAVLDELVLKKRKDYSEI